MELKLIFTRDKIRKSFPPHAPAWGIQDYILIKKNCSSINAEHELFIDDRMMEELTESKRDHRSDGEIGYSSSAIVDPIP